MTTEGGLAAVAAVCAFGTAFMQWMSIRERRRLRVWLHEHGEREEAATMHLIAKHDELTSAVRSATPPYINPIGVPKE